MKSEAGQDEYDRVQNRVSVSLSARAINKLRNKQAVVLPIRLKIGPRKFCKSGKVEIIPEGYDEFF